MSIHELAIVLNVLSIVFSLAIWVLMRFRHSLPPWSALSRVSQLVNRYLFVFNQPALQSNTVLPHYFSNYEEGDMDQLGMGEKFGDGCVVGMSNGVVTISPASNGADQSGGAGQKKPPASPTSPTGPGSTSTYSSSSASTFNRYQLEWNQAFLAMHALGVTLFSLLFVFGYLLIR